MQRSRWVRLLGLWAMGLALAALVSVQAQDAKNAKAGKAKAKAVEIPFPPAIPGGKTVVTDTSPEFLKPAGTLREGVQIAQTPPTVDFLYYPGQDYPGNPWSNWGDGLAVNGKYYSAIGDHWSLDSKSANRRPGNAFVYEYDPKLKSLRLLVDLRNVLKLPDGHYSPAKIHGRIDMGGDGWLYFSTHRGSPRVTTDEFHYKGDWILRAHPGTGQAEVVVQAPVPKHCIPCSVLDPKRMIFYGGTAQGMGAENEGIQFFAYDVVNKKLLHASDDGPARYMILAQSTGRVYFNPGRGTQELVRWDPDKKTLDKIPGEIGIRAATQETPQNMVYTVSLGQGGAECNLFAFNTKTEKVEPLGPAVVGKAQYIASIDADPSGRYLYYVAGAHGGSDVDGTPIVQFDTRTRKKKVIAFLHPYYQEKYGATLRGTYSTAVDEKGEKLYVTWNVSRGSRAWDSCALTVIHIPESERQP